MSKLILPKLNLREDFQCTVLVFFSLDLCHPHYSYGGKIIILNV